MEKCDAKHKDMSDWADCPRCGETILAFDGKNPIPAYLDRIAALKAENSKLRAALEKIENKTIWNNNSLEQDFNEANEIAREALASGGEGK